MSQSKLTLIGMYNYFNSNNEDLFLHMSLPAGINKDIVIDNILMRGGEFEVLYSNPYFLRDSIVTWSKKWHWTFDKWLKAVNTEYNPLENYDRIEEGTETQKDESINTSNRSDTRTDNLKEISSGNDNSSVINTTSAFNSADYSPKDKSDTNTTNKNTIENTGTQSQTGTLNGTIQNDMNKTHSLRIHGNIGVTTSQQMLQSEIDVALFNLYDKIADVFLQEYIIPIY